MVAMKEGREWEGGGREGLADNGVREFEITRVISDVLNTSNERCVGHLFPHCRERERGEERR